MLPIAENAAAERIQRNILNFTDAVGLTGNLEIVDTDMEVLVIRDNSKPEDTEGAYIEISVEEVILKADTPENIQAIINVINTDRAPIVLNGITRIVGYYSRVNNWNKSKIGELRDRVSGTYGLTTGKPKHQHNRLEAIDAL